MRNVVHRGRWYVMAGMMVALAVVVVVLSIVALSLRTQLNDTEARLSRIEVRAVAEDAARKTGEVATCFASARGRPALAIVLRLVASLGDVTERRIINQSIGAYVDNAPTIAHCRAVAAKYNLDPKDFPPAGTPREGENR